MTKLFGPRQIAVIGAGYAGLCVANYLKRDGHQVTIFTSPEIVANQTQIISGIAGIAPESSFMLVQGFLRNFLLGLKGSQGTWATKWPYFLRNVKAAAAITRMAKKSKWPEQIKNSGKLLKLTYQSYNELLGEEITSRIFFETGGLILNDHLHDNHKFQFVSQLLQECGVEHEYLEPSTLQDFDSHLPKKVIAGMYFPQIASVPDQNLLLRVLQQQFLQAGGIIERQLVKGFTMEALGPSHVIAEQGNYPVDAVVLATGVWSKSFLKELGYNLPLLLNRTYHLNFYEPAINIKIPSFFPADDLWVIPSDMGLKCVGGKEWTSLHTPPNFRRTMWLQQKIQEKFPAININNHAESIEYQAVLPDALPLISNSSIHRNVFFSLGYDHMGISFAAIAGRIIRDLVADRDPGFDIADYSADRFE